MEKAQIIPESNKPVKLMYFEEFERIDEAYYRERQIHGWSRKKKEALINHMPEKIHEYAKCINETHYNKYGKKEWK